MVIIGAGEVGGYLAERLSTEGLDVVVIEVDPDRAAALGNQLDVQVICGSGSNPDVLIGAGIRRTDLMAAVTENDEVNMIASLLAKQHGVETTVVRVEAEAMRGRNASELLRAVGADVVVDPDAETADEILELVHATGADEVYPMADGELAVIGAVVADEAPLAHRSLGDIGESLGDEWNFLFGAITRHGETVIPRGEQILLPGDHVRVVCRSSAKQELLEMLGVSGRRAQRVMVLGGGAVGSRVAGRLQDEGVEVVLVERDGARATALANEFQRVMVVQGDVTDTELLLEESVGEMDAVVAATGEDSANVLACAFAIAEGSDVHRGHPPPARPAARSFAGSGSTPRSAREPHRPTPCCGPSGAIPPPSPPSSKEDSEVDELEIAAGQQGRRRDGWPTCPCRRTSSSAPVVRAGEQAKIVRGRTELRAGDHIIVFGRPNALAAVRPVFRVVRDRERG